VDVTSAIKKFILALALLCGANAYAYVVGISAGTRSLYLEVGMGLMTGGNGSFSGGATPGNNTTVNSASVTVPAISLGAGTQVMTTDSTQTMSPYDNYAGFCVTPSQVYVGGFYRAPVGSGSATLAVSSPSDLMNGSGNRISFNNISWVSGGTGDTTPTIPSGTFAAGTTQTLLSVALNKWFESCLQFNYANNQIFAAGTYSGRATYILSAP
jgi:hypothetical protein